MQNIISNKPQNVNSVSTGTVDNMKQVNGGQASNNVVSNQNASSIAVNNTNKSANLSTASVGMARGVNLMPNMNNNNQAFWNENSQ